MNNTKQKESSSSSSSSSDSDSDSDSDSSSSSSSSSSTFDLVSLIYDGKVILSSTSKKSVTSLGWDKSGNRLISGQLDGLVSVWDFTTPSFSQKLNSPLRVIQGDESANSQAVTSCLFNNTGSVFCVGRNDAQVRIYKRDNNGTKADVTSTRGDPYIRDLISTKGHIAAVVGCVWSRKREELLFTCSRDGTVRIWDVNNGPSALMGLELANSFVLKTKSDKPGTRLAILGFCVSPKTEMICAVCNDGSLQFWFLSHGRYSANKPDLILMDMLEFKNQDDAVFCSFSNDEKFIGISHNGMFHLYEITTTKETRELKLIYQVLDKGTKGFAFHPSENNDANQFAFALLHSSAIELLKYKSAAISSFSTINLNIVNGSATSNIAWHPLTNQLAVACSNGEIHVCFDTKSSILKGALYQQPLSGKAESNNNNKKKKKQQDLEADLPTEYRDVMYANVADAKQEEEEEQVLTGHEALFFGKKKRRREMDEII